MTCPVPQIRSLFQQEVESCIRAMEPEHVILLSREDPMLHLLQFEEQDLSQLYFCKRPEHDNFVDPVHEFRRKPSLRGIDSNSIDLAIYLFCRSVLDSRRKTDSDRREAVHFTGTQVGRH